MRWSNYFIKLMHIFNADVPLWLSALAVIVADPAPTPETSPLALTVAMAALPVVQVIVRPLRGLPLASLGVAASCTVAFTAIVAEDEPILRAQLEGKLAKLWPELEIIASVEDGAAALEALEDRTPDFMFLDIQMPEMTGVEVARHVAGRSHIVFVTAYDQYAIQAFEAGAVDYILKPATDERLEATARAAGLGQRDTFASNAASRRTANNHFVIVGDVRENHLLDRYAF